MNPRYPRRRRDSLIDSDEEDQNQFPPKKQTELTMASRHELHKRRQQEFINNRIINIDEDDNVESMDTSEKAKKPFPPIVITSELKNVKSFHQKVKTWGTKIYFRCPNDKQQIITYTQKDYEAVQQKLKEVGLHYITYTPATEKPKFAVLKGISGGYDENDVLDDLKQQSTEVVSVKRMKSKRNGVLTDLDMFLVSLKPNASIVQFAKSVRFCCNYKITLEHYIKPKAKEALNVTIANNMAMLLEIVVNPSNVLNVINHTLVAIVRR